MYSEIERKIGYTFKDKSLLDVALTHSSYANEEKVTSYETLEFVGDALLGYVAAAELMQRYPKSGEGKLTAMRAELVSSKNLSKITDSLDIMKYVRTVKGAEGTVIESINVKCDIFESLTGAILVDNGYDIFEAKAFILRFLEEGFSKVSTENLLKDYKSQLIEICAKSGKTPEFRLVSSDNKNGVCSFGVVLYIDGKPVSEGSGSTKKDAEKDSAKNFLKF